MKKIILFIILVVIISGVGLKVLKKRLGFPDARKEANLATITELPELPDVPLTAYFWSDAKKRDFTLGIIDSKLITYPKSPKRSLRAGKHITAVHPNYELREDQLKILADNYDLSSLPPRQKNVGLILRKYNPNYKLFMYIDYGIQPEENLDIVGDNVGNIDEENVDWIIKNHPDWLLRDEDGNPVRSGSGLSNAGEYWGDPGNKEFQEFFASKINKALAATGNIWDAVLLDQFFGILDNFTNYANANQQTKYKTDAEFQAAQSAFIKRLSALVTVPVVPNLDGATSIQYPNFFIQLAKTSGGIENEIYPFENSDESDSSLLPSDSLKLLIEGILRLPKNKYVRIGSKPGGMAGNIDRMLYAYFSYLLIASPDREIYWAAKEGDASIPHYWFKEFDLDLGKYLSEVEFGDVWKRELENATIIVNPYRQEKQFNFQGVRYNVKGGELRGSATLSPASGILLFRSQEALNKALAPLW